MFRYEEFQLLKTPVHPITKKAASGSRYWVDNRRRELKQEFVMSIKTKEIFLEKLPLIVFQILAY